jgi:hypothetical protein
MWLGTDGGGINVMSVKGDKASIHRYEHPGLGNYISAVCRDRKGNLWVGILNNGVAVVLPSGQVKYFNRYGGLPHNRIYSIFQDSKNTVWVCTAGGIARFPQGPGAFTSYLSGRELKMAGASSAAEGMDGTVWFCGNDSVLEVFDGGVFRHYTLRYKLSGAIVRAPRGTAFLLGTEDNGLLECSAGENSLSYRQVLSPEDIDYTTVNSLVTDDAGSLWIGTSKGIYRFDYTAYLRNGSRKIKEYGREEGLISLVTNENAVFRDQAGKIWFGTVKGLTRADHSKSIPNREEPVTSIQGIRLFFEKADLSKFSDSISSETGLPVNLDLPHYNNHVTFDFIGVSFTSPRKVAYRYKLEGFDKSWSPVRQETFVTYSNLPPGDYTFMVLSSNNDGVWNTVPATYSFSVRTPFWITWWFITACTVFLLLTLYLLYRWRIAQVQHTADLQRRILESEQKALRTQMNPHFIFNSLNSIQHFITDKDVKSANRYLSKFSKLMRMILDNSRKPVISLAEELESLRLYLDIESLRFENKFEYHIGLEGVVDPYTIDIPPMLLQPYIENAIWHGLSYKKDLGYIDISFEIEGNFLICSIEDNGIGRKRSQELKIEHPAHRNSAGMSITSERLQSIGELKGSQGDVEVTDLVNAEGEGVGTLVKIRIPID